MKIYTRALANNFWIIELIWYTPHIKKNLRGKTAHYAAIYGWEVKAMLCTDSCFDFATKSKNTARGS